MTKKVISKEAIVRNIWNSHPQYLATTSSELLKHEMADLWANLFCPGPHCYYVMDSTTFTYDLVSDFTLDVLGIERDKLSLSGIIDLIHPEDIHFFFRCEDVVAHFLRNCITPDKILKYKISYCLRMRTSPHASKLILLQTVTMKATEEGSLLKVFTSFTDINHITAENNYKMNLNGLYGEPSYLNIDVFAEDVFDNYVPYDYSKESKVFTPREVQVLKLLSLGNSTDELAALLTISYETAATHRKNLLRKAGCKNTTELVAECIRKGVI